MKVVSTAALCIVALCCSTAAAHFLSILWWGEWWYPEVVALMCGPAVGAVVALAGVAYLNKRRHGSVAVLRLLVFMAVGCGAITGALFFGVSANCRLLCGNTIKTEFKSLSGQWRAVWFLRSCVSQARYCPTISYISVLAEDEALPDGDGNAFGIVSLGGDDDMRLKWKSDDLLFIGYLGIATVVPRQNHVGSVRVEYQPVGFM